MYKIQRFAIFFLLFQAFAVSNISAQTPNWAWAQSGQLQSGSASSNGTSTDAAGNTYSIGYSFAGVGFGLTTPDLPPGMFLVKHTAQGNPVWAKQANCTPLALTTDAGGNTYVTGKFYYADNLALGTNTLVCQGRWDMFTAKFDSAGNVLWAKRAGGAAYPPSFPGLIPSEDEGNSIGIDSLGNCYVGAKVVVTPNVPANFDSISIPITTGISGSETISVLAKYNSGGEIQWVRRVTSSPGSHPLLQLGVTLNGDCFGMGMFLDSVSFGNTTLYGNGSYDVCYARYNAAGNLVWAKSFGGPDSDYAEGIAVNNQGVAYVTGLFKNSAQIGSYTLSGYPGASTLYLAKCDPAGNVLWATQTTGSAQVSSSKVATDNAGNSYVACQFAGTLIAGPDTVVSNQPASSDVLVLKCDANGNIEWTQAAKGSGNDHVSGIALSPGQAECYVTGSYEYGLAFGSHTLNTGQYTNFYLAKLQNIVNAAPEIISEADWAVYPNPTRREVYVQLPQSHQVKQLQLLNANGQTVLSQKPAAGPEIKLPLPALPQGLYVLSVQTENQVLRRKIVIQ